MKLTELETRTIEDINESYLTHGIENTEFHNLYGWDAQNKSLRGAFSSLKKKGVVDHVDDKGCFNPIFPTEIYLEVIQELGLEVPNEVTQLLGK